MEGWLKGQSRPGKQLTQECAPEVWRGGGEGGVGRGVRPEGEGCTDPLLKWGEGKGHQCLQFHRPGGPPLLPHSRPGPETPYSFLCHLLHPVTAKDNKLSMAHLLR